MPRSPFGWDYPPGAEHDPRAPWNEKDDEIYCYACGVDCTDEQLLVDGIIYCSYCYENSILGEE